MKSKTIELDLATAKRVYKTSTDAGLKTILEKNFGKSALSENPIDTIETLETLDDVFEINGTTLDEVAPFRHPKNDDQKSTNADAIIKQITRAYNGGEELDWSDSSQPKYALYFQKAQGGGWVLRFVHVYHVSALLGAGHYFKTEAHARDAHKKFKTVWDEYLPR